MLVFWLSTPVAFAIGEVGPIPARGGQKNVLLARLFSFSKHVFKVISRQEIGRNASLNFRKISLFTPKKASQTTFLSTDLRNIIKSSKMAKFKHFLFQIQILKSSFYRQPHTLKSKEF